MRILVADAHANFRNVLVTLLHDDGHEVHGVAYGGELVAIARRIPVDVILTHVRFEDLDALEALEYLVKSHVHVPTILMSGDLRAIPHDDAARLGVVAYLEKPFAMGELRSTLAAAVRASARRISIAS